MLKSQKQGVRCLDRLSDVKKHALQKARRNVYSRKRLQEVDTMVLKITAHQRIVTRLKLSSLGVE